LVQP